MGWPGEDLEEEVSCGEYRPMPNRNGQERALRHDHGDRRGTRRRCRGARRADTFRISPVQGCPERRGGAPTRRWTWAPATGRSPSGYRYERSGHVWSWVSPAARSRTRQVPPCDSLMAPGGPTPWRVRGTALSAREIPRPRGSEVTRVKCCPLSEAVEWMPPAASRGGR